MRSPGEFLSEEVLKVKYARRLSTEYPSDTRWSSGGCQVLLKALSWSNNVEGCMGSKYSVFLKPKQKC